MRAGDDGQQSDAEERRITVDHAGDDAEQSDAEERRITDDGGSTR
ncbi:MAG: hypothetical protein WCF69_04315 [Mycobacterium sp.]